MRNNVKTWVLASAFLVCLFPSKQAAAYWFAQDLTETEYNAFPPFCKFAFREKSGSGGAFQNHAAQVPIGYEKIPGGGHFCVGLVAMNRSVGKHKDKAKEWMSTAASEIHYTYSQMDRTYPKFSWVSAYYGKALYGAGERQKAFDVWRTAIQARPAERESYLLMSEALISEQRLDDALRLLMEFDEAKEQPWPDAEYFFGYLYYKKGRYDDALTHLEKAKELGYPNDGLRAKILNLKASRK